MRKSVLDLGVELREIEDVLSYLGSLRSREIPKVRMFKVTQIGKDPQIARQANDDLITCERMLDVLNSHIAELDETRASLVQMRQNWTTRHMAAREGRNVATPGLRAPRGSIRWALLAELESGSGGLTVDELVKRLTGHIANFNRRSVSSALGRLKDAGLVEYREPCWHKSSERQIET